jgi:hypothetical protein
MPENSTQITMRGKINDDHNHHHYLRSINIKKPCQESGRVT